MIHLKNFVRLLAFITLLSAQAPAQTVGFKFPDSPGGARVAAYFKAFNSGDEGVMSDFMANNIARRSLEMRSVEDRIQVYREMRQEFGALEPHGVRENTARSITILARSKRGGWFIFQFELEPVEPYKILGLGVEDSASPKDDMPEAAESSREAPALSDQELIAAIEKLVDEQVKADEFSGAVMLARNNRPIFQKAYGFANKEHNVPNRVDTKFNLGSINKKFTQVAIMQLADAGRLSLDDRLIEHLPEYPNKEAAEKITIRQLLDMTSGIGDFFNEKYISTPKNRIRTINDYMSLFANEPLLFEPGTSRRYSNGGYVVLGAIIEKISGQDYYDYVREHIYKPAGMENSDSYEADVPVPNLASGYTRAFSGGRDDTAPRRNNMYLRPARGGSAGGGYSTLGDMLKFTVALQGNRLLSPKSTARVLGGGLGIGGGAEGLNAALEVDPGSGYTVIVLSNYDPPSAEQVARQIRGLLRRAKR